jgi:ABC-type transporter Mla MlaB component
MAQSVFGQSQFSDSTTTPRNSLLRRLGLYMKKPYLDWDHTHTQLNPNEEDALRSQFMAKRERRLTGRESERDLQDLRGKITRSRAQAERIANGELLLSKAARGLGKIDDDKDPLDSISSRPRPMQSTLQHTQSDTVPLKFEGSNFTLSEHIAPGQGMEVKTLDQGDLQSLIDESVFSFAMGDEISAEAVLLHACEDYKDTRAEIYPFLLDLYRITQQTQAYAAAASLYTQAAKVPMGMLDMVKPIPRAHTKPVAARTLSLKDVQLMEQSFELQRQQGKPCELRFDGVTQIDGNAIPLLGSLLDRIANTPKEFSFAGLSTLTDVLQKQASHMLASQDLDLHRARYNAARLAGNIRLFEDAARDFSIIAQIPMPAWRAPRCMLLIPGEGNKPTSSQAGAGHLYFALTGTYTKQRLINELLIQNAFIAHSSVISIDCSALHSMTFDGASRLVDWVAAANSVGVQTKLTGLHRFCERLLLSVGADKKWLELSHAYA